MRRGIQWEVPVAFMSLTTPVALLIFNRPDLTQRVFAEIAKARPQTLFVVADGARSDQDRKSTRLNSSHW